MHENEKALINLCDHMPSQNNRKLTYQTLPIQSHTHINERPETLER